MRRLVCIVAVACVVPPAAGPVSAREQLLPTPRIVVTLTGRDVVAFRIVPRGGAKPYTFQCAVDREALHACRSVTRRTFATGRHSVRARVVDAKRRASRVARTAFSVAPRADEIRVGDQPLTVTSGGGFVWSANYGSDSVSRIDPATRRVTTIRTTVAPYGITFAGGALWVGSASGAVTRIDPATAAVTATFQVGGEPLMTVLVDGVLWVANHAGTLDAIDPATGAVSARVALGGGCNVVVAAFGLLWVGNQDGTVSLVDPSTRSRVGDPIRVDPDVVDLAVTETGVWAASYGGSSVSKLDPVTHAVVQRVRTPSQAAGLTIAAGSLWAANYGSATISRIDPATGRIVATVYVGDRPRGMVEHGRRLWVANQGSNSVSIVPLAARE